MDEIMEKETRQLMVIPKKDFADCFKKWKGCFDKLGFYFINIKWLAAFWTFL